MKTEPRRFRVGMLQSACWIIIIAATSFGPLVAHADGCFVVPKFVWDKHKDINEPTQKAIIAYDSGHEDLILQVKYDGPVEEFGWLIPVPSLPTVKKGSIDCFYELSRYTQKLWEPRAWTLGLAASTGAPDSPEPVKVIEIKTVGAYEVAVLSAKDTSALEKWLEANHFFFPSGKSDVIDSYLKRRWYFVAARIRLGQADEFHLASGMPKGSASQVTNVTNQLANGELHPLHLSFESEKCVFPLKISSVNDKPSEVQIYLLSTEPLIEKGMFAQKLVEQHQWRTNRVAEIKQLHAKLEGLRKVRPGSIESLTERPLPDDSLSAAEIDYSKLLPYAAIGRNELPICAANIALLGRKACWLTKQTWTFKPDEMRDLKFESAVPVLSAALADEEGAFAAANLMLLGGKGEQALLHAMSDSNPSVRAHAMSIIDYHYSPGRDGNQILKDGWLKLLPSQLADPDPAIRLYAIYAAGGYQDTSCYSRMIELLRDENMEVSDAAREYLVQDLRRSAGGEVSRHIPLFQEMLNDTNANVQQAALLLLSGLRVHIPREQLVALLSVPKMEVCGVAFGLLGKMTISCEEAKPLLHNSLPFARVLGLTVLAINKTNQSVELAIPLLNDPEEVVRTRAHDMLIDFTGQDIPASQPDQWRKWWNDNKRTFVITISPEELREKQLARMRQRREMEDRSSPDQAQPGRP